MQNPTVQATAAATEIVDEDVLICECCDEETEDFYPWPCCGESDSCEACVEYHDRCTSCRRWDDRW